MDKKRRGVIASPTKINEQAAFWVYPMDPRLLPVAAINRSGKNWKLKDEVTAVAEGLYWYI